MGRQESLLALLEPAPALTPAMREVLVPMLAALLLEAVIGDRSADEVSGARHTAETGGRDEQDRR